MSASTAVAGTSGEQASAGGGHSRVGRGLVLAALGVVFGDIGTSPLYALQTVFSIDNGAVRPTPGDVYGVISLMFWSITLIVSVKYVSVIMRADNDGEGGVMALAALAQRLYAGRSIRTGLLLVIGIVGVSLFYGDSVITPAHQRAVGGGGPEGRRPQPGARGGAGRRGDPDLPVRRAAVRHRHGSASCSGRSWWCGSSCWPLAGVHEHRRSTRACCGRCRRATRCCSSPTIPAISFVAMGAVVLVITGAEALYADMGHFGPAPIRRAWFFLVFPALTLNYLGQAALILHSAGRGCQSVLPAAAELEPAADGGAGHRGHRDRQPGGDLRRVLAVPAGDAARAAAAADGPADLRAGGRPDLPAGQSTARCSSACWC